MKPVLLFFKLDHFDGSRLRIPLSLCQAFPLCSISPVLRLEKKEYAD